MWPEQMTCAGVWVQRDEVLKVPVHGNERDHGNRNVYAGVLCLLQMERSVVRAKEMSSRDLTTSSIAAGVTTRVTCAPGQKDASKRQTEARG